EYTSSLDVAARTPPVTTYARVRDTIGARARHESEPVAEATGPALAEMRTQFPRSSGRPSLPRGVLTGRRNRRDLLCPGVLCSRQSFCAMIGNVLRFGCDKNLCSRLG